MPADRFLHPRLGHSQKVSGLDDLEFRIWVQYVLSADDFGIMPLSAAKIQGDNRALEKHPRAVIDAALTKLVEVGLVVEFQHQDERFVCQLTWCAFQKIRYPRATHWPCPPAEVLERVDSSTLQLLQNSHEKFPKDFRKSPRLPRARGRETANGLRQTASREGSGENIERQGEQPPFDVWLQRLTAAYPEKARSSGPLTEQAFLKVFERDTRPPVEVAADLMAALENHKQGEQWRAKGMIPKLARWLSEGLYSQKHEAAPSARVGGRTGAPVAGKYAQVEG